MSELTDVLDALVTLTTNYGLTRDQIIDLLGGTLDGGPNGDGYYPITLENGTSVNRPCLARIMEDLGVTLNGASISALLAQAAGYADQAQSAVNDPSLAPIIADLALGPDSAIRSAAANAAAINTVSANADAITAAADNISAIIAAPAAAENAANAASLAVAVLGAQLLAGQAEAQSAIAATQTVVFNYHLGA